MLCAYAVSSLGALIRPSIAATQSQSTAHCNCAAAAPSAAASNSERALPPCAVASIKSEETALSNALKAMVGFSNSYAKRTATKLCSDASIPAHVLMGLAEHKATLGVPLCPCRAYDDKVAEAKDGYWNCPCVPMRERHECHCMLFMTDDNEFVGDKQTISLEETIAHTTGAAE